MKRDAVIGSKWLYLIFSRHFLRFLFGIPNQKFDFGEIHFSSAKTIEQLAVEIGAYKSKGEARRAGRVGRLPKGWNEIQINKYAKIFVLNET